MYISTFDTELEFLKLCKQHSCDIVEEYIAAVITLPVFLVVKDCLFLPFIQPVLQTAAVQ